MILKYNSESNSYETKFKSKEQVHGFNTPFQVGTDGDNPEHSLTFSHDIEDKDVIILATDGLWDNLDDEQIKNILNENTENNKIKSVDLLSLKLAEEAERLSNDE